jgi:hypothetical protein
LSALLSFVGALALAPLVGSEFIPETDKSFTQLTLRMPVGSSLERTDAKVRQVEEIISKCMRESSRSGRAAARNWSRAGQPQRKPPAKLQRAEPMQSPRPQQVSPLRPQGSQMPDRLHCDQRSQGSSVPRHGPPREPSGGLHLPPLHVPARHEPSQHGCSSSPHAAHLPSLQVPDSHERSLQQGSSSRPQ